MALILVSRSSSLPVTLADVKAHLRVTWSDDDAHITNLTWAAVDFIEQETQNIYVQTTWDWVEASFPYRMMVFPKPPLQSVTSITYYDANNQSTPWASGNYYEVKPTHLPAYLVPKDSFPDTYDRPDAVTARIVTGYTTLPENFKHAIKLVVGHLDRNRETVLAGQGVTAQELPMGVRRLVELLKQGQY